ncbi:MAG: hypothetical protein ABIP94_13395 [Planctomycetota bacterium]
MDLLLPTAGERIGEWSSSDAEALLAAASALARFCSDHAEATNVRTTARHLIALASTAGAYPARVLADPGLRTLHD